MMQVDRPWLSAQLATMAPDAAGLDAARLAGLPGNLHTERLSNLGRAKLAAEYGALSADHLEYLGADAGYGIAIERAREHG